MIVRIEVTAELSATDEGWEYHFHTRKQDYTGKISSKVSISRASLILIFNIFQEISGSIIFKLSDRMIACLREEFKHSMDSFLNNYCSQEFSLRRCHFEDVSMISS